MPVSTIDCPISCGVRLIRGEMEYKTAAVFFKDFISLETHERTIFIWTHSEVAYPEIGDKITKYIHDNGLGTVVKSKPGGNPVHSGREITVWVWTRDNKAFAKHAEDLCKSIKQATAEPLNSTVSGSLLKKKENSSSVKSEMVVPLPLPVASG